MSGNRRWTLQEEERLKRFYRRGLPLLRIAQRLDRSYGAVVTRITIWGLKR